MVCSCAPLIRHRDTGCGLKSLSQENTLRHFHYGSGPKYTYVQNLNLSPESGKLSVQQATALEAVCLRVRGPNPHR